MMEIYDKTDSYIMTSSDTHSMNIYVQNPNDVPPWIIHRYLKSKVIEGKMKDIFEGDGVMPSIRINPEHKEDMFNIMKQYEEIVSYRYWGDFKSPLGNIHSAFELFSVDASKGLALEYLEKVLEIPHENTYGFGDQLNDISLITKAYHGVAMINADLKVKNIAKEFTDYDFNHNGVVKYMKKNKLY